MTSPEYFRAYYQQRRAACLDMLGGQCVRCGSSEELEFDHIDRTTKTGEVTTMLKGAWSDVLTEVAKCQLLCQPCHQSKSVEAGDVQVAAAHGGTRYRYGCRCDECRAANAEYQRQHRTRKGTELAQEPSWKDGSRVKRPAGSSPVPSAPEPELRGIFIPVEMTPARLATIERLAYEAESKSRPVRSQQDP